MKRSVAEHSEGVTQDQNEKKRRWFRGSRDEKKRITWGTFYTKTAIRQVRLKLFQDRPNQDERWC